jgi:multidrug resistance protein, MATE family
VIVARAGIIGFVAVDTMVLGRFSYESLADFVLGGALSDACSAILVGLLMGTAVITARLIGEGRPEACGMVWRRGLLYALVVGGAVALLLQFTEPALLAMGHDAAQAERSARVTGVLGLAAPFLALYVCSAFFLEALGRPVAGMVAILLANALNAGLDFVLVFGAFGVPPLGAVGAAWASVLNQAALAVGLASYIRFFLPGRTRYGVSRAGLRGWWRAMAEQRRLGLAAGASNALEASSFAVMALFAGLLGAVPLAAYGISFQFVALPFMIAFGLAAATQVRVGNAWGRGDRAAMVAAGWVGLLVTFVPTGALALVYVVYARTLPHIFTTEAALVAAVAETLPWIALALMFDGGQSVMNFALRGRGETWVPTALHFGSYWVVMVPAAAVLAFALGRGASGLFQGVALASLWSFVMLAGRFAWLARRR